MSTRSLVDVLAKPISYGCRAVFLGSHLIAIGFVAEVCMPRTGDASLHATRTSNLLVDVMLLLAVALQYIVTRSPPDVARWIAAAGSLPATKGATLLATSRALLAAVVFWRPLDGVVWSVGEPLASLLVGLCVVGVLNAVAALFRARRARVQCYAGCVVALWSAPTMTVAHALIAVAASIAFVGWFIASRRSDDDPDVGSSIGDGRAGPSDFCPR